MCTRPAPYWLLLSYTLYLKQCLQDLPHAGCSCHINKISNKVYKSCAILAADVIYTISQTMCTRPASCWMLLSFTLDLKQCVQVLPHAGCCCHIHKISYNVYKTCDILAVAVIYVRSQTMFTRTASCWLLLSCTLDLK